MLFVTDVLIGLASIAISYFILTYCRRRSSTKTGNMPPGPKAYPLIGNAYHFLRRSSDGNNKKIKILFRKLIIVNIN